MSLTMFSDFLIATGETLYMVLISTLFAALFGLPLGTLLFTSAKVKPNQTINRLIAGLINFSRSIPFIILLVALIPFTRLLIGTSIGIHAAMVPLTIGATPFFARLVDNVYQSLSGGLIEAGHAMGANTWQMIRHILLPEATPQLIHAITVTAITLVNYSAMAGTVGGGGLGDLAIRYGYQRFNVTVMLATVFILVVIVQLLQMGGDRMARRFIHH
ncbi:methionine ABC transporter permease [Legionella oakridgensis]|uniref:ABC-type metal ion transport system, permease component n=2 Tax=Legionella oakridgensis TaxID=29423 RepID=W0BGP6_9GAMM|nr:methionine ABC transporter permease [Legionella oakridgensis]AHE67767.1 ABC-type metal ion transport system, permease component [Legionella oakridgensis ATCC 33761 = DSM 21215]ETO92669.1 ABC-type metal ion transport system, permease component [Legionella oakridgensis RV-2-2007]KTD36907.1 ABC-type metal ion transport system, permease component [Legionella oakridgensis]STY20784.1 DL-methionine transporter subunit; membrane component protein of ABC superfamily [Legionella longbeachae]